MESWRTDGSIDWLCPEPDDVGAASAGELGLVWRHGYAHEAPADLGIGSAAVYALAREMARPRELTDHRVVSLDVALSSNLLDTVLVLPGEPEALRSGLGSLEQLLRDPAMLEAGDLPDPRQLSWSGWANELSAWVGMGPAALAAATPAPWSGETARLHAFVRSLHPTQGGRLLAWTTVPGLAGSAFREPPVPHPVETSPLAWRQPGPTAAGPAAVTGTYLNNLISFRVAADLAGDLAIRLVARTVHRNLVEFAHLATGIELAAETIGGDTTLVAVRATTAQSGFDPDAARLAALEALDAVAGFPDHVLAEEVATARSAGQLEAELRPSVRATEASRRRTRRSAADIAGELDALTVADVRRQTARAQAESLLGVTAEGAPVTTRPLLARPALPAVTAPTVRRRALVALGTGNGLARQTVRATPAVLEQTWRPLRRFRRKTPPPVTTSVDLTGIVVREDLDEATTTLIDRESREVTLAWPTYRRPGPLRALVDAATPPAVRVQAAPNPALTADLHRRVRRWRIGVVVQAVAYAAVVVLFLWGPVTGGGRDAAQQPTVTTVPVGQIVTLANGSTVQLSHPDWRASEQGTNRHYLVLDVRYCGGGKTVDEHTSETARNYVTPDRFSLGPTVRGQPAVPLNPGDLPLVAVQLPEGQCTQGVIGFLIYAPTQPSGFTVRYQNGSGDQIDWTVS